MIAHYDKKLHANETDFSDILGFIEISNNAFQDKNLDKKIQDLLVEISQDNSTISKTQQNPQNASNSINYQLIDMSASFDEFINQQISGQKGPSVNFEPPKIDEK